MRFNFSIPSIYGESLSWYEAVTRLIKLVREALMDADATLKRANEAVEKAEEIIESGVTVTYSAANESITFSGFNTGV